MALSIQTLATALANPEGDAERLIIQYPAETPGKIGTATLKKLLIPRERSKGTDSNNLFTLCPPDKNNEKAIELYSGNSNPGAMIFNSLRVHAEKPNNRGTIDYHDTSNNDREVYSRLKISEVDQTLVNKFSDLVELSLGSGSNSKAGKHADVYTDEVTNFIQSTFSTLAQHAENIQYETWNTEDDLESCSLASKLKAFSENFPFTLLSSTNDMTTPSNVRHGSEDRKLSRHEARLALYKLTLSRLLVLLYARESSPETDVRIWELAGQLLALAGGVTPMTHFAIKAGLFVLKCSLDCLIPGSDESGAGSGGGGSPGSSLSTGASALAPRPTSATPWRRVAALAGLCTVAVAPVVVLGPLAAVLGFGALGPVAGGIAAGWQGAIGLVEAGSIFAMLQGIGMAGAASAAAAPLLATVSAAAGSGAVLVGRSILSDKGERPDGPLEFAVRIVVFGLETGL